jgi:hypothetical protein
MYLDIRAYFKYRVSASDPEMCFSRRWVVSGDYRHTNMSSNTSVLKIVKKTIKKALLGHVCN